MELFLVFATDLNFEHVYARMVRRFARLRAKGVRRSKRSERRRLTGGGAKYDDFPHLTNVSKGFQNVKSRSAIAVALMIVNIVLLA